MNRQLLVGTRNPARIDMLRKILQNEQVKVLAPDELKINQEVEEDGQSTQANAEKKARFYYALSSIPTLAMDGGVHIDRFPPEKQPGIWVNRVPGFNPNPTPLEQMNYYIHELEQVGGESPGTWTASQALVIAPDRVLVTSYTFLVHFTSLPKGKLAPGRVLDPLMIDPQSGKYYPELALEEKPYYLATRNFILEHLKDLPSVQEIKPA